MTSQTDRTREDAILREAARRATWEATRGPRHLRSGRYRPEPPKREGVQDEG